MVGNYQKIFIKNKGDASVNLTKQGDFNYSGNIRLTNQLTEIFSKSSAYCDIMEICNQWFKKPPLKLNTKSISDAEGNIFEVRYTDIFFLG